MMDENNDGAVTLESQLDYRVQRPAKALFGFDDDHVKVLYSEDMVAVFNTILGERADGISSGALGRLFRLPKGAPQDTGPSAAPAQLRKPIH